MRHGEIKVVPALRLFRYKWRNPFLEQKTALHDRPNDDACVDCVFSVGDLVWVKPPGATVGALPSGAAVRLVKLTLVTSKLTEYQDTCVTLES